MRRTEGYLTAGSFWAFAGAGLLVWLAVGLGCLLPGQVDLPPGRILAILTGGAAEARDANIVLMQRLPRVLMGLLAGGGLAVAGAVFQALLRNPLATPHTLGVSAGGALGAVVAISLGLSGPALAGLSSVQFFALVGALVNIGIVYLLARRSRAMSPLRLLLAGVTLGLICSALIMFVRFVSDPHKLVMVDRWLMGGLDVHGYRSVGAVLPFFLPGLLLMVSQANALNQLALGEEMAGGRGVSVGAVQREAFLAGSALTAAVVSVAGPIGFVGLLVPHALRGLFGPDHRLLLCLSFFGGGAFLAAADTVARAAFAPSELPVGVLTAMLGGPFFLLLLVTRMREV
ncbi:MAG: iron ABC transporter permease [Candidatus Brocadiaceae bacterium]|jgi:iron complex transport system permease protein